MNSLKRIARGIKGKHIYLHTWSSILNLAGVVCDLSIAVIVPYTSQLCPRLRRVLYYITGIYDIFGYMLNVHFIEFQVV